MYGYAFAGEVAEPRRDSRRAVAIVVAVVLLAASAGAVVSGTSGTRSWFPKQWDPRVAPIAAEVAKLRGLAFEHPVPIHYLDDKAFARRLASEPMSARERARVAVQEEEFRALGFIGGKDDLLRAYATDGGAAVLAYYDPDVQEIFVRGTTLDVEHRVTVAHEMTHALQDQHFDLRRMQAAAAAVDEMDSLRALYEGDAVRVEEEYLKEQSAADQKEYKREYAAEGDRVRKAATDVPDVVGMLGEAPYDFGPPSISVIMQSGGNDAVNDALTGPVPSSTIFTNAGDLSAPIPVASPLPPGDATRLGPPESFGPFETYLMLSMRMPPVVALDASDDVGGGSALAFRSNDVACYRVVLAPISDEGRPRLRAAVERWAAGRAKTSVDDAGDDVGFTACDPGPAVPRPDQQPLRAAFGLLMIRTSLTLDAVRGHTPGDVARCEARLLVQDPRAAGVITAVGDGTPTRAQRDELFGIADDARRECRADSDSGLS